MQARTWIATVAALAVGSGAALVAPERAEGAAPYSGRYGERKVNLKKKFLAGAYSFNAPMDTLNFGGAQVKVNLKTFTASITFVNLFVNLPTEIHTLTPDQFPVVVTNEDLVASYAGGTGLAPGTDPSSIIGYNSEDQAFTVTVKKYKALKPDNMGRARCKVTGTFSGQMDKGEGSTQPGPQVIDVTGKFNATLLQVDGGL